MWPDMVEFLSASSEIKGRIKKKEEEGERKKERTNERRIRGKT